MSGLPVDYPRTQAELEARFATEQAGRAYLASLRWPQGFRCPRCGHPEAGSNARGLWVCRACRHQASVTAGTIFQDSRLGLRTWFRAIWWVCSQKNGVSALGLQRILGFGSYETAWTWLHKLRRAMVRPGRDALTGTVEVDATFVGGVEPGGGRRHIGKKVLVGVAAEVRGRAIGRIRLCRIADGTAESLVPFVREAVAPGATVITDGFTSYGDLTSFGYRHRPRVVRGSGKTAAALLPRVHRVASLLKRWLLGTHQGAVSRHHLDYYLDEFTFRFNRRTSRSRGLLFYRLVENAVRLEPGPYDSLVRRRRRRSPQPVVG